MQCLKEKQSRPQSMQIEVKGEAGRDVSAAVVRNTSNWKGYCEPQVIFFAKLTFGNWGLCIV